MERILDMFKKIKEWADKPLSAKVLLGFIFVIVAFYLAESLICKIYDGDMYFLIATGREILDNGIPHTNVWTIDQPSGFISQQWLYAVFIALADKVGYVGFTALVGVQFGVLLFLLNHFFNLKGINKYVKWLCIAAVVFYSQIYLFSTRPELITMILLLAECIALEHFHKSNRWQWLILLPVTMLAEMNFHGSMWPMHYAILLAYMVPSFYLPGTNDVSMYKQWKPIALFTLLMTGIMFVNPYGLDGVMYIIKSFKANTFAYVDIQEIASPIFLSASGLTIMLGITFIFLCHKLKTLDSTAANIALGFIALCTYALRHNMFSIFIMAFLLRCLAVSIQTLPKFDWKKDVKNNVIPVMVLGVFVFGVSCLSSFASVFTAESSDGLTDIYEYIAEDYNEDTHIFTGFNNGAYFEWKGFRNVYMDARPELYTDTFTGSVDILGDYSKYCIYGFDVTPEDSDSFFVTKDEMDEWFYSYDFDYVVVSPMAEAYLACYMMDNEDYHRVDSIDSSVYILYEKVN